MVEEASCTKVKVFSWWKRRCSLGGREGVHIWRRGFDKWCTVVLILGGKIKDKGKSQAGGLGTGCRSQGPNQDKSLLFTFAFSEI